MADRLTQLQDTLNQLAEHFCNSIGIIQQAALNKPAVQQPLQTDTNKPGEGGTTDVTQEGHAQLFATLIAHTVKDVDYLIDALPSEKSTTDLQMKSLIQLEKENEVAGNELQKAVDEGQILLDEIRTTISNLSNEILQTRGNISS